MASAKRGTVLLPALTQTLNILQAAYARRVLSAGRVGIPENSTLHHACTIRPMRIGLNVHLPPVVEALQKVTKATISNEECVRHACVMVSNRIFRLGGKRSCLVTCSVLASTRIIHYISLSAFLKIV